MASSPTTGGTPQHSISQFSTNTDTISTEDGNGVGSVNLCIEEPEHSENRGARAAGSGSPSSTIDHRWVSVNPPLASTTHDG